MDLAELIESLREELRGMGTPWRTRAGAANYVGCTESTIDIAVARGDITRYYLYGSPRFKVSELDRLIGTEKSPLRKAA